MMDRVDRPVEQLVDEILVMDCRNSIKREIKRLELRIAELNETVKNK